MRQKIKGAGILRKVCGNFAEISGNFSADLTFTLLQCKNRELGTLVSQKKRDWRALRAQSEKCKVLVFFRGPQMGGSDPSWLNLAFLRGAPIFRPKAPKLCKNRYLGASGLEIGAPQKRQILPRRI